MAREQSFNFTSRDTLLAGTLELPEDGDPGAAALLLSGSGPQDRDESIGTVKPFAELSRQLTDLGFAVFRWDDRGVGASEGDYLSASAEVLAADITAALDAVLSSLSLPRALLIGHSQGALFAAETAARAPEVVSGLVLLAGMALPGEETLLIQHRALLAADGWSANDIQESLAFKQRLFRVLRRAEVGTDTTSLERQLRDELLGETRDTALDPEDRRALELLVSDLLEWEWRFLLAADPARTLSRVPCPVLALYGDRDTQVPPSHHLEAMREALMVGNAPACRVEQLAGCNHLFQVNTHATEGPGPAAWASAGPPFSGPFPAALVSGLAALELLPRGGDQKLSPGTNPS